MTIIDTPLKFQSFQKNDRTVILTVLLESVAEDH